MTGCQFWLLGVWLFSLTDAVFWGVLGVFLIANTIREQRKGRARQLNAQQSSPAQSWRLAVQTAVEGEGCTPGWHELVDGGFVCEGDGFTVSLDPARVGLAQLMPDFEQRMGNLGRNIAEGRLGLIKAVLRAA